MDVFRPGLLERMPCINRGDKAEATVTADATSSGTYNDFTNLWYTKSIDIEIETY